MIKVKHVDFVRIDHCNVEPNFLRRMLVHTNFLNNYYRFNVKQEWFRFQM